jgi:hypothetical protein
MCYNLQSCDLITDSIKTVMGTKHHDANISIAECDRNMSFSSLLILHTIASELCSFVFYLKCRNNFHISTLKLLNVLALD